MTLEHCPACTSADLRIFHEKLSIPVNSCLLLDDADDARAFPRGDLVLAFCRSCGFIFNTAFDIGQSEYSARYEETQGFSQRFRDFAQELATQWVTRHHLEGKSVLEIGCGKGEFLVEMVKAGAGSGIGIDPSFRADRMDDPMGDRINWIADFYGERYSHLHADAIVCRHTLEHISPVNDFVAMIKATIREPRDRRAVRAARRRARARRGGVLGHLLRALQLLQPRVDGTTVPPQRFRRHRSRDRVRRPVSAPRQHSRAREPVRRFRAKTTWRASRPRSTTSKSSTRS